MSGNSYGRNSSINYSDVNNQKTLIYDLRSQLSNLKNQFSRLISKPADQTNKPKIQVKYSSKSRYSQVGCQNDNDMEFNSASQTQISSKFSQSTPALQFKRTDNNIENRNNPVQQKLNNGYRKTITQECTPVQTFANRYEYVTKPNQVKKSDNDNPPTAYIKKNHEAIISYKKINNSVDQLFEKASTASRVTYKNMDFSEANNSWINDNQLDQHSQKIKKLEEENKQLSSKINNQAQKCQDLQTKLSKFQNDFKQSQSRNQRKDEKIAKLQEIVRELTQKVSKANQVTLQIGRQKTKQIQTLKQGHSLQLKNQQKDFQKRLTTQKQNIELKHENNVNSLKQNYQSLLAQSAKQKSKLQEQIKNVTQNINKMRININQLEKEKLVLENQVKIRSHDGQKQSQTVKCLLDGKARVQAEYRQKVQRLEAQLKIKATKPTTKQIGVNCQKVQIQEQVPQASPPVTNPTSSGPSSSATCENSQLKGMQQKMSIYLCNIDKQSQKIKQQKMQIQKLQRGTDDFNRAMGQKQQIIRNIMRDCKILEKDLNENRRVRRELDHLVQEGSTQIIKMNLKRLDNKYRDR